MANRRPATGPSPLTSLPIVPAVLSVLCTLSIAALALIPAVATAEETAPAESAPQAGFRPSSDAFLRHLSATVERLRTMNLREFRDAYGPSKAYRVSGPQRFIRGDVNGDGRPDISDARCILSGLFLGDASCRGTTCEDAIDVDDDGRMALTDAIRLLDWLFRGESLPPAPFPDAGEDPTRDDLACPRSALLEHDPFASDGLGHLLAEFPMSAGQLDAFGQLGFVIAKDWTYERFFDAYKQIFTSHVPVYISADAILETLHLSLADILRTIEEEVLIDRLDEMLWKLEHGIEAMGAATGSAAADPRRNAALDDVAIWVCTARVLLHGEGPDGGWLDADGMERFAKSLVCPRNVSAEVARNTTTVRMAQDWLFTTPTVRIFGRDVAIAQDRQAFTVRGHYQETRELTDYFLALSWLEEVGARLTDDPREAAAAWLLSRLLRDTGALSDWQVIRGVNEAIGLHGSGGGGRGTEAALGAPELLALAETSHVDSPGAFFDDRRFTAFSAAVARSGAGVTPIERVALSAGLDAIDVLEPARPDYRIFARSSIADSFLLENAALCAEIPQGAGLPSRTECRRPSSLDVWFALGNRATVPLLALRLSDPSFGQEYRVALGALEWTVSRYPESLWESNVTNMWISALRSLAADTTGSGYPDVVKTEAWERRMLNTTLASWAQLRRDFLGYIDPPEPFFTCDFPDGWVDPYPTFFRRIERLARLTRARLDALGVLEQAPSRERVERWFDSLAEHSARLAGIAAAEAASQPLDAGQRRFVRALLSWDVDVQRCPKKLDGWFMDLLYSRRPGEPGDGGGPVTALVYSGPGGALHVGTGYANLMLVSVSTDCGTRAFIGPVLSAYERTGWLYDFDNGWGSRTEVEEAWTARLDEPAGATRPPWTADFVR